MTTEGTVRLNPASSGQFQFDEPPPLSPLAQDHSAHKHAHLSPHSALLSPRRRPRKAASNFAPPQRRSVRAANQPTQGENISLKKLVFLVLSFPHQDVKSKSLILLLKIILYRYRYILTQILPYYQNHIDVYNFSLDQEPTRPII